MAIKKKNPRYLVSLDGYDLATVPAFTKVEAVKRAKQIYPGRRGTWTAVQVEDEMFGRMRGGAETEARMRLERKRAAAAARKVGGPSKTRNGKIWEDTDDGLGIVGGDEFAHAAVKERYKDRLGKIKTAYLFLNANSWRDTIGLLANRYGKRKRTYRLYIPESDFDTGKDVSTDTGIDVIIDTTLASQRWDLDRSNFITRKSAKKKRNGTHIHAETVGHLDVARVHNPYIDLDDEEKYQFIVIPYVDGDDEIYPVETAAEIEDAQAAMVANGLKYAPVYLNDHGETVKTGLILSVD